MEICAAQNIDLVFTDLRMPVMEGMELLAELRKKSKFSCNLSGCGRREDVIEALRLGASNFLLKPEVEMIRSIAEKILRVRTRNAGTGNLQLFVEERQFMKSK